MKNKLQIEPKAQKPKYQQIVDEITERIQQGLLKRGDQLPTINEITASLGVARMTVIRAYEELRERGIVAAQHGKGYYIASTNIQASLPVFVLFDAMNAYKEVLFHAMKEALGENVSIDLFFHYHDLKVFENVIVNNIGNYTNSNEESSHVVEDESGRARVWILEGPPALFTNCRRADNLGFLLGLIFQHAFAILAYTVAIIFVATVSHDVRHDSE